MDSNLDFPENKDSNLNSSEDIDFKIIFNFFNRNKKFISSISIIFVFLGILISYFPKRVWEGQFQIVLNLDKDGKDISGLKSLSKKFSLGSTSNNLNTEVGILKSPSVLMPAYELAKGINNEFSNNIYEFSEWKNNNLLIMLQRNTSILNISYKDTNKSIILPVLKKMSSTYQEYSAKRKKRIDQNTESYLKEQIKFFKEKSAQSLKKAQEFAIDQDLFYFDMDKDKNISRFKKNGSYDFSLKNANLSFLPQNINIENIRVNAANEIRQIDLQLDKISNLKEDEELGFLVVLPDSNENRTSASALEIIDAKLVEMRSKYTDEDANVRRLLEQRKLTIQSQNKRAINFLKAKRLETQAKMEAALRPKGVLLKYKELIRNASRDETTLIEVEDELRELELRKTRQEPPWELITKPTVSKFPVDTIKRDIILISLFLGASLSSVYSFFKEKKSGKIFEYKDFKKLAGLDLGQIMKFKCNELNEVNTFLNEYLKYKYSEGINLIKLGSLEESKTQIIKENLTRNKIKINMFDSILDLEKSGKTSINFLILEFGYITFSEVETLKKFLQLFNINLIGTIIIEKD